MPSKESLLFNFLLNALMYNKYPGILSWLNETEGIFCLRCVCKYQKKKWSKDTNRIFEDYHKLKPRKSENKQQTLLLALKASPSTKILEDMSTKEVKYYKLLNKTKNLPLVMDSEMLPSEDEIDEIFAKSPISTSVDLQYSGLKNEAVETPCSSSIGMHVFCNELKNEMIDLSAESSRSAITDMSVPYHEFNLAHNNMKGLKT